MAYTFNLAPGEYLIQCPYNQSHQITNARMLTHLDKCRRNYKREMAEQGKECDIQPCRFNSMHQYPKIELDYHHRTCPDQYGVLEHIRYHQSEEFQKLKEEREQSEPTTSSYNSTNADDDEEDWDKDCEPGYQPGYDPTVKLENSNILYMPPGLSKSQRKAFQKKQRERMRDMKQEADDDDEEEKEYASHLVPAGTIRKT